MASSSNQHSADNNSPTVSQDRFQVVPTSEVVSPTANREFVFILTNKSNILRYDPQKRQDLDTTFYNRRLLTPTPGMNSDDEKLDMDFVAELYRLIHAYLDRTSRVFPLDYIIEWSLDNTTDH